MSLGTYCQERELEGINKADYSENYDNPLCRWTIPGIPSLLTIPDTWVARWACWEATNAALMLKTYSVGLNPAGSTINSYSMKMILVK